MIVADYALNYAGDKIVTMESPAPYANRELKKLFDSGTTDPTTAKQ